MPEQHTSISEARKNLPKLSQAAKTRMDRYIITHQGQPQSVLLGYKEYLGMKAALELLHRPEIMEDIEVGLKDFEGGGERLSPGEVRKQLEASAGSSKLSGLATELGRESGLDARVVASVIDAFVRKIESPKEEIERVLGAPSKAISKAKGKLLTKMLEAAKQ
jgi:PHD/YefM family antitoxin component YafN of YafNO toxin-antitoxin module